MVANLAAGGVKDGLLRRLGPEDCVELEVVLHLGIVGPSRRRLGRHQHLPNDGRKKKKKKEERRKKKEERRRKKEEEERRRKRKKKKKKGDKVQEKKKRKRRKASPKGIQAWLAHTLRTLGSSSVTSKASDGCTNKDEE